MLAGVVVFVMFKSLSTRKRWPSVETSYDQAPVEPPYFCFEHPGGCGRGKCLIGFDPDRREKAGTVEIEQFVAIASPLWLSPSGRPNLPSTFGHVRRGTRRFPAGAFHRIARRLEPHRIKRTARKPPSSASRWT